MQKKSVPPRPLAKFFVGREVMNERIKRYLSGKHQLLSDNITAREIANVGETKSVWYDKEYLNTLMQEIEDYGGDGLRIYFGEYENINSPTVCPGQLCLLIVPTRLNETTGKHTDLILEEESDFDARLALRDEEEMGFNIAAPNPPIHINQECYFPYYD